MRDRMYDELALEREINERFGMNIDIRQAIIYQVPVGPNALASLLLTTDKQLYLYVSGQQKLNLGDVKKIIVRMGLKADVYIPPKGRPQYFDDIGRNKVREVFPGRKNITNQEIIYYRTLAPYNPALVLISEVIDGKIYQFDSDATTKWRMAAKFAYRRIKTS